MKVFLNKIQKIISSIYIIAKNNATSLLLAEIIILTLLGFLIFLTDIEEKNLKVISYQAKSENITELYRKYRTDKYVNDKYETMSFDERVGQLFITSIDSTYISDNTKDLIQNHHIGGVVIMSNNIASKDQLKALNEEMQKISNTNLFIATDQEGGSVARIPWDYARYISQPHIGKTDREDFTYSTAKQHAESLKELGINQNLAPVLDLAPETTSAMFTRSLGPDTQLVSKHAIQIIKAHKDNNILATAKHFPGIGRSNIDSHYQLPTIDISKKELLDYELKPFETAIDEDIDIIMSGHALYPQIDENYPASLSEVFLKNTLRDELGFEGLIISDDINMGALGDYPDKSARAIKAGNDMVMIVAFHDQKIEIIEKLKIAFKNGQLSEKILEDRVKRVLKVKFENEITTNNPDHE